MPSVACYVWLSSTSWAEAGFEGRDELEDPLDEALSEANLGEVTGGGSGRGAINIDVDIWDASRLGEGLALIRRVLNELGAPSNTYIKDENGRRYELQE
jgi:hypothetical protein